MIKVLENVKQYVLNVQKRENCEVFDQFIIEESELRCISYTTFIEFIANISNGKLQFMIVTNNCFHHTFDQVDQFANQYMFTRSLFISCQTMTWNV